MNQVEPDVWLDLNLTIVQLKSLIFIYHMGVCNFKQLADALKVSPPNVTGIIDRMVEQDLVSREDNPQNRRMQMLKVTPRGASILKNLHERGTMRFTGILNSLSLEELAALEKGLSALSRAVEQAEGEKKEIINR
jgi:DNA-binding MarR family transcriptional regulator